jgi:mitogen-activated protein kinase kinase
MERHNRKSYLAPPPPKSLKDEKEESPRRSPAPKPAVSKSSRTPHYTPTSGEIPLNVANEMSSHSRRYHIPSNPSPRPSRSTRSPPPISLEHLSLETKDDEYRPGRRAHLGDPVSALEPPARQHVGSRSASSHNINSRKPLQSTTLPPRGAPPSGPLPPAPVPGAPWQR